MPDTWTVTCYRHNNRWEGELEIDLGTPGQAHSSLGPQPKKVCFIGLGQIHTANLVSVG